MTRAHGHSSEAAQTSLVAQVLKFCTVGVANTAFYYGAYRLFLYLLEGAGLQKTAHYMVAHVIAWCCAIVFSFFLNCYFTFKVKPTWRRFVIFPSTTLANFIITTVGAYVLIDQLGVPDKYGTVLASLIAIPVTFTLTRWVLHGSRTPVTHKEG